MSDEKNMAITTRVIVEVLGAPKEHIEKIILRLVDKMQEEKDFEILSEETAEATERDKLFSTFSELEIKFKNLETLEKFLFDFTPSSVEIIEPEIIQVPKNLFSGVINDFMLKFHQTALEFKDMTANTQVLARNTDAVIRNFLIFALEKKHTTQELAKITGIPESNIGAILEKFEKAGVVKKEDDSWIKT